MKGSIRDLQGFRVLKGSWDFVTRATNPFRVLITLLTKPPDPPSREGLGFSVRVRLGAD